MSLTTLGALGGIVNLDDTSALELLAQRSGVDPCSVTKLGGIDDVEAIDETIEFGDIELTQMTTPVVSAPTCFTVQFAEM